MPRTWIPTFSLMLFALLANGLVLAESPYKMALIHSYHAELDWVRQMEAGINETLPEDAELQVWHLNSKNVSSDVLRATALRVLEEVRAAEPRLVFITDDAALGLLGEALSEDYFVVFGGINGRIREDYPWAIDSPNTSGILERPLIRRSLLRMEDVLILDGKQALILAGPDSVAQLMLDDEFEGEDEFTLPNNVSALIVKVPDYESWQSVITAPPGNPHLILTLGVFGMRDRAGNEVAAADVAAWSVNQTDIPLFSIHEQLIGPGQMAGGMVVSGTQMGNDMANLALEVLARGKTANKLDGKFRVQTVGKTLFSTSELRRLNIEIRSEKSSGVYWLD